MSQTRTAALMDTEKETMSLDESVFIVEQVTLTYNLSERGDGRLHNRQLAELLLVA